jgi:hypothetical protein
MAVVAQAHPFVSPRLRGQWAKIFLVSATVFIIFDLTLAATRGGFGANKELHDALTGLNAFLYLSVLFLSAVTFLLWLHRAVKNLSSLGARTLRFTPGWAVGWFFVPVMNLIRPSEVVTELWHASDPAIQSYQPAPRAVPAHVRWWWGLFILAGATGRLADQLSPLMIVSDVLAIPAAILAMRLIGAINQNQERKHTASPIRAPG